MLHSLRKLRVRESPGSVGLLIQAMFQGLPSPVLQDPRLSFLLFGEELQGEEEGGNREVLPELGGLLRQANPESVSLETSHRWGPLEPPPDIASLLAPYVNYFKIREGVPADECFGVLGFGSRWLFGSIRTCRWNVSNYSGHMLERRVSEWEHTHSL